ncbi:MAG: hypothetical protein HC836_35575 [Richelia sp. RM2_1_2]|nr:hypothetical protein [Richelia sp. RM2_1_2]
MNNNTQVYAFLEKLWHQYPDLAKNDSQASLKKLWLILLLGGTTYYSLYINSAEWLYITLNVFILCVIFLQLVFIVVSFLGLITVYSYEQQADFNGKLKIRQAFDKRYLSYNVMNYDIITSQRIAYMVCLAAVIGMLFLQNFTNML